MLKEINILTPGSWIPATTINIQHMQLTCAPRLPDNNEQEKKVSGERGRWATGLI